MPGPGHGITRLVPHLTTFGPLRIAHDDRILAPRPWTVMQALWATDLLLDAPGGPVLELCCGAGHIGLLAIAGQPRALVAVDDSPVACDYVRRNAEDAGLGHLVDVRRRDLEHAAEPGELFALVLADPPWVPSDETDRYPGDVPEAIDGGPDGLEVARACVRVAGAHLAPGGSVLLQLGSPEQVASLERELEDLSVAEMREGEGGVVARLVRRPSMGGSPSPRREAMQRDLLEPSARRHRGEVGAGRLPAAVGRRAGVEQSQPGRGRGVPRDVAVPEDQHVEVGEQVVAPALAALRQPGLVDHAEPDPLDLGARDRGQPLAQDAVVVVAVHPDQPGGTGLEQVEQRDVDPVTGVDDDVGGFHLRPDRGGQVTRPRRHVGVGDDQQSRRHTAIEPATGYLTHMTTAPLEPAADPDLSPDAPDPVAPGIPEEPAAPDEES